MNWKKEWPTKSGFYWFYGWAFQLWKKHPRELYYVQVLKISNGFLYITNGYDLDKSEAEGRWQPVILPKLPSNDS